MNRWWGSWRCSDVGYRLRYLFLYLWFSLGRFSFDFRTWGGFLHHRLRRSSFLERWRGFGYCGLDDFVDSGSLLSTRNKHPEFSPQAVGQTVFNCIGVRCHRHTHVL